MTAASDEWIFLARSGQEIQAALRAFAKKWQTYDGTETAEAQTFRNELFACFGNDRHSVGAVFEDFAASAGSWTCTGRQSASSTSRTRPDPSLRSIVKAAVIVELGTEPPGLESDLDTVFNAGNFPSNR